VTVERFSSNEDPPATEPEPAAEPEPTVAPTRTRWTGTRVIGALLAVLFFGGPAIAGTLGVQPQTIENRALAPFPSLSDGWDIFPALTGWATDHLPLRDRAVRVNNKVSQDAFGEMPATAGSLPTVILGRDGWLYYSVDIGNACSARNRMAHVADGATRLAGIVAKTNAAYLMTVAPNKTSIETENLPDRYPLDVCASQARADLHQRLATTPPPGYFDLFGPIAEVKREHTTAYLPQDTHWTDFGCIRYATELVQRLDPALLGATTVTPTGPRSADGDLNTLRGIPGPTIAEGASLTRSGVSTQVDAMSLAGVTYNLFTSTSTDAALWPGRTVIIGDSFSDKSLTTLAPFFGELVFFAYTTEQASPPKALADLLLSADTVIFEQVERYYVSDLYPVTQSSYLDSLEEAVDQALRSRSAG
jgi:alginate O-acetyltransferase complex protein AlgJ